MKHSLIQSKIKELHPGDVFYMTRGVMNYRLRINSLERALILIDLGHDLFEFPEGSNDCSFGEGIDEWRKITFTCIHRHMSIYGLSQYGFRVIRGDEPSAVKHGFKYGNGKEVIKHNLKNLLRLLK